MQNFGAFYAAAVLCGDGWGGDRERFLARGKASFNCRPRPRCCCLSFMSKLSRARKSRKACAAAAVSVRILLVCQHTHTHAYKQRLKRVREWESGTARCLRRSLVVRIFPKKKQKKMKLNENETQILCVPSTCPCLYIRPALPLCSPKGNKLALSKQTIGRQAATITLKKGGALKIVMTQRKQACCSLPLTHTRRQLLLAQVTVHVAAALLRPLSCSALLCAVLS